ncbi:hypothetical protein KHQ88_03710 [Mycoplasmatota bacterium]|nr:hypothetical protein KHQ88_03710 [Mycoplasmatota bacterium]
MGLDNIDFALYLNITFFAVLAIGLFFGLLKGFRRSLYTFVITVIFIGIFFLTVNSIVAYIYKLELGFLGGLLNNISSELSQTSSVQEAVRLFIFNSLGDNLDSSQTNPEFLEFIDAIGTFILKIAYTLIYFTVIQFVYRLILFIIGLFIFRKGRSKNKKGKRGRLLGGVFGTLTAAINVFVLMIILSGVISISESLVSLRPETQAQIVNLDNHLKPNITHIDQTLVKIGSLHPEEMAEQTSDLDEAINSLNTMIDEYHSNIFIQGLNSFKIEDDLTGVEKNLAIVLFDEVLSINYKEEEIALRQDLRTFTEIAGIYLNSDYYDTQDLADLSSQEVNDIFLTLSQSKLITTIIPIGIEVGMDYMDIDYDVTKEMLYEDINWKDEISQLGVVASTGFMILENANAFDEEIDYKTISLDGDEVEGLFTALSESKLVEYGAYIAIEPLLEGASDTVQSVITVPEDMDWQAEFQAFGMIANEILSTGLTIADLESENQQELLMLFTDVDLTVLLNSTLTSNALINIFSGQSTLDFNIEFLVIPDVENIQWKDTIDELTGDVTQAGELRNVLSSLNILVQQLDKINMDDLKIQDLSSITDAEIDELFESVILVASISQLITDLPTGDFSLVIPDRILDENDYIIKDEVTSIFKALTMAAREIPCDEGNTACEDIGFDLEKVTQLSSDNIDTLFTSDILYATTATMLNDFEELIVPEDVKESILVNEVAVDLPSITEIKNAFSAITVMGISSFDEISMSGDLLLNLSVDPETDPTTLDTDKSDKIFASKILHATISYFIFDQFDETSSSSSILVVPYTASQNYTGSDNNLVRYYDDDGEVDYLSEDELTNLLKAILALELNDFSSIDTLEFTTIISKADVLLESAILHATISKQVLDLESTSLVVPEKDENDVDLLIETSTPSSNIITYIKKSELLATLDALEELDITSFENLEIGVSVLNKLALDNDPTSLDTNKSAMIFESNIIHATISDFIVKEADGSESAALVLPYYASVDYPGTSSNIVRLSNEADEVYITVNELDAIIAAFLVLGLEDFNDINSLELDVIFDESPTLLASAVLHATISKQIMDLGEGENLVVPDYDPDDVSLYIVKGTLSSEQTTYIKNDEINNTLSALKVLEITDFNQVKVNPGIIKKLSVDEISDPTTLSTSKMNTLLSSNIVHATISKVIRDAAEPDEVTLESAIVIPTYAADDYDYGSDELNLTTIGSDEYIVEDELTNLVRAYLLLEINDFDSVSTLDLTIIADKIEIILESAIFHATISKQIIDASEVDPVTLKRDIIVPYIATDPYSGSTSDKVREKIRSVDEYITKLELYELFEVLEVLNITDFNNVEGTLTLPNMIANQVEILESAILHATMSDTILEEDSAGNIIVPYKATSNYSLTTSNEVRTSVETTLDDASIHIDHYISKHEFTELFDALTALSIDDFANVETQLTLPNMIANESEILESAILHATMSDSILDESTSGSIYVPYTATDDYIETSSDIVIRSIETVIDTNEYVDTYIVKEEFGALFDALTALSITDFDQVQTQLTLANMILNKDALLKSAILHATMSNTVIDENTLGTIIVPYKATRDYNGTSSSLVRVDVETTLLDTSTHIDTFINKNEFSELFEALGALSITDFANIQGQLTLSNMIANKDSLLESAILHATMSDIIIDESSPDPITSESNLILPNEAIDHYIGTSTNLVKEDIDTLLVGSTHTDHYVSINELNELFEALDALSITDFDTVSSSLTVLNMLANMTTLLESAILHATISEQIFDLDNDGLIEVPNKDIGQSTIVFDQLETTSYDAYIVRDEIGNLLEGLDLLGASNISGFTGTLDITSLGSETDQNTVLDSAILHATFSKQLTTMNSEVLIVPEYSQEGETIDYLIIEEVDSTNFIIKTEIKSIINAFIILEFDDVGSATSFDLDKVFANPDVLLESSSIQATISDKLLNDTGDALIIPDFDINQTPDKTIRINQTNLTYIELVELKAILSGLESLGLNSFSTLEFTTQKVFASDFNIVLASASLQATISDTVLSGAVDENNISTTTDLIIPNYFREAITVETLNHTQVEKNELHDLLNGLKIIGVSSFTGGVDPTDVTGLSAVDLDILLDSGSLHVTVDNMLQANNSITIPSFVKVDLYGMTDIIEETEIINFIVAVDTLGESDLRNASFNFSVIASLTSSQQDTVLSSAIVRATITPQVKDAKTLWNLANPSNQYTTAWVYESDGTTLTKASILDFINHQNS